MSKRPRPIKLDSANNANVSNPALGTILKLALNIRTKYLTFLQAVKDHTHIINKIGFATTTETNQNMKPLFTAHDGQTLFTAKHQNGQRLYVVQEASHAGSQTGYHVIWNPAQTPRELLQAAIQHDRNQDIRLTATDVPNQDIAPTAESEAFLNHNIKTQ
jgi:hypothetical protein